MASANGCYHEYSRHTPLDRSDRRRARGGRSGERGGAHRTRPRRRPRTPRASTPARARTRARAAVAASARVRAETRAPRARPRRRYSKRSSSSSRSRVAATTTTRARSPSRRARTSTRPRRGGREDRRGGSRPRAPSASRCGKRGRRARALCEVAHAIRTASCHDRARHVDFILSRSREFDDAGAFGRLKLLHAQPTRLRARPSPIAHRVASRHRFIPILSISRDHRVGISSPIFPNAPPRLRPLSATKSVNPPTTPPPPPPSPPSPPTSFIARGSGFRTHACATHVNTPPVHV